MTVLTKPVEWSLFELLTSLVPFQKTKSPVLSLETEISKLYKARFCQMANLGRTVLESGLKALFADSGSKILLPAIVCPTVIKAVLNAGFTPVIADTDHHLHLTLQTIRDAMRSEVKGVIVPHLYGLNASIDEISEWCRHQDLKLVDDAAQAVGLSYRGRLLGTFGDLGILSFGPYKNIGISRGGALITNREDIRQRLLKNRFPPENPTDTAKRLLSCLMKLHTFRPYYLDFHDKFRKNREGEPKPVSAPPPPVCKNPDREDFALSETEARLIHSTLKRRHQIFSKRIQAARALKERMRKFDALEFPETDDIPFVRIPVRIKSHPGAEAAVAFYRKHRIEAERIYKPLHYIGEYRQYAKVSLVQSEKSWEKVFLLPNPVWNGDTGADRIISATEQMLTSLP